jgi:hypothetical protein
MTITILPAHKELTYEEWETTYKPLRDEDGSVRDFRGDGDTDQYAIENVWSWMDDDGDYIANGTNAFAGAHAYHVTEIAWQKGDEIVATILDWNSCECGELIRAGADECEFCENPEPSFSEESKYVYRQDCEVGGYQPFTYPAFVYTDRTEDTIIWATHHRYADAIWNEVNIRDVN